MCVLILPYSKRTYVCPHTTVYVSYYESLPNWGHVTGGDGARTRGKGQGCLAQE